MYEYASAADSSGGVACPARAQEGDNLRFSPSCESSSFPWRERRKSERRDRSEKEYGSRVTVAWLSPPFRSSQTAYCYTGPRVYAGATYPCRATRRHVIPSGTYEFIRSIPFICAGAVYCNTLKVCAALLCRTQRRFNRMCSSNLSDPANMRIHGRAKRVLR